MSRTPSAPNTSLRDQLGATLRAAAEPMSAKQLAAVCSHHVTQPCGQGSRRHEIPALVDAHWKSVTCHGDFDLIVVGGCVGSISLQLAAMERKGLCRRTRVKSVARRVVWEWTGEAAGEDELAGLEDGSVLTAPPPSPGTGRRRGRAVVSTPHGWPDVLDELTERGITIAWTQGDIEWPTLWLVNERVLVLNSHEPQADLTHDVRRFLDDGDDEED